MTSCIFSILKNCENNIISLLDSFLNQDTKPSAIILLDNQSDDTTYSKICEYLDIDKIKIKDKWALPPTAHQKYNNIDFFTIRQYETDWQTAYNNALKLAYTNGYNTISLVNQNSIINKNYLTKIENIFINDHNISGVISDHIKIFKDGYKEYIFTPQVSYETECNYDHCNISFRPYKINNQFIGFQQSEKDRFILYFLKLLLKVGVIYHIDKALYYFYDK